MLEVEKDYVSTSRVPPSVVTFPHSISGEKERKLPVKISLTDLSMLREPEWTQRGLGRLRLNLFAG